MLTYSISIFQTSKSYLYCLPMTNISFNPKTTAEIEVRATQKTNEIHEHGEDKTTHRQHANQQDNDKR